MKNKKLKNIIDIRDGTHDSPKYLDHSNYLFITSKNLNDNSIDFETARYISESDYSSYIKRSYCNVGDIIFPLIGTIGKNIVLVTDEHLKNKFAVKNVAIIKPIKNKINNKFLFYWLKSDFFYKQIRESERSGVVSFLGLNMLRNMKIILPTIIKQEKISVFLDENCYKIDNEVSLLEQKSIFLDEYKNALIYETVTKGLDKNAVMKDSGVEWIGEVPNHWKIKRVCDSFNGLKKTTQPGRTDVLSLTLNGVIEKDIENLKGLNPESYDTYQIFKKDNLVFKLIDLENYKTSRVGRVFKDGIMSSAYIRLEGKKNTNIDYNYYQFFDLYNRGIFNSIGSNGVRSTLNRSDLLKISLVVPPQKEQIEISKFLDTEIFKITKQIELINKKVELLKEYKQSLIYEVVTGQLEIE